MSTPPWAREIDDVLHVPARILSVVIPAINPSTFAMALKTVHPGVRAHILSYLDPKIVECVLEEMEFLGPASLAEIEAAQRKALDAINRCL